jgi:hypothetical protein
MSIINEHDTSCSKCDQSSSILPTSGVSEKMFSRELPETGVGRRRILGWAWRAPSAALGISPAGSDARIRLNFD